MFAKSAGFATFLVCIAVQSSFAIEPELASARIKTATAIKKSPDGQLLTDDVQALATLRDFAGARAAASKILDSYSRDQALDFILRCEVEHLIEAQNPSLAEKSLKTRASLKATGKLWLGISEAYSKSGDASAAKRTAFYAVTKIGSIKDADDWKAGVTRLAEVGERDAAKRLVVKAQQELLNSSWVLSAKSNQVVEAAAQCGFDVLAFQTKGNGGDSSLKIWGQQGKYKVARDYINLKEKRDVEKLKTTKLQYPKINLAVIEPETRLIAQKFGLMQLRDGQVARKDLKAALETTQEISGLPEKFKVKDSQQYIWRENLDFFEANALWDLADRTILKLNGGLAQKNARKALGMKVTENLISPEPQKYEPGNWPCIQVIFSPSKFSEIQRKQAGERMVPRIEQMISKNLREAQVGQLLLARVKWKSGISGWMSDLQKAQQNALNAAATDNWVTYEAIALLWREAGQPNKAQEMGQDALKWWSQQKTKSSPLTLAHALISCGCYEQAMGFFYPRREVDQGSWMFLNIDLAKNMKSGPPDQIKLLDSNDRSSALQYWAKGLEAAEENEGVAIEPTLSESRWFEDGSKSSAN